MEAHSVDGHGEDECYAGLSPPFKRFSDALQELPSDRCPGEDGLSPIFFTTLWEIIGLLFAFQAALQSGS